ncbi:actin-related protein 2/3 complex subunit 2B isoform X1 [Rutidosis leptorrhynchoides]|uniref:actin-related protein 2/3 complex subunit 2B isoform X1 n=1 Tax=Rutidosis leptorrhynchoides TaxID=125765 RepID=UPI003A9A4DCD
MKKTRTACFERASPALKQILLQLYCADKPLEVEHNLHEFGSLQYHIQSYATEPHHAYLSISTPVLSTSSSIIYGFSRPNLQTVKKICREVVEIIEPARAGYQLTLKIDFTKIPRKRDAEKIITDISSVQAAILSSQLKQILTTVSTQEITEGAYKPIKLVYHPNEPFYVVKQPTKLTAVFPIRLKEDSDVVIAKAFFQVIVSSVTMGQTGLTARPICHLLLSSLFVDFEFYCLTQELVDVGRSGVCPKAPSCYWSPIPPPELRGESMKDLSTNGGFVSFDIFARHVHGKKLDKTVWNLLNFNALVKYHVKCTKGFVQRRMRSRLDSLVEALQHTSKEDGQHIEKVKGRRRGLKKLINFTRRTITTKRWNLTKKIKRIRSRIRIRGFKKFHRGWLKLPCFSSVMKYQKLDKF